MKLPYLIFMLICFSAYTNAQNNYANHWKKVTQLERKGLTKSAAEIVDSIYVASKADENNIQLIKALIHKSKYLLTLQEEAQLTIVNQFKTEIEQTNSIPTKHLLENLLATMYWQYFQQNRFRYYQRTKTANKPSDDFRTWDLNALFNEIHSYYQRSLQNGQLLQEENLTDYEALLIEHKESKRYRPTLYDLLSHNALTFYKTDENSITQPSYKFVIDNEAYLASSDSFINLSIEAKDSTSLQLNAIKIYQNLLKCHSDNRNVNALVDIDIERLNFIKQHAVFENKIDILMNTLKESSTQLEENPLAGLYNFEMAKILGEQGNLYNQNTSKIEDSLSSRWKLKEAIDFCNTTIDAFPGSEGAERCEILKKQIMQPEVQLRLENHIPAELPSKILVTFKNLTGLRVKIYKVQKDQWDSFKTLYNQKDQNALFRKLNVFNEFEDSFRNEGDYQMHSTEVALPKLPHGLYIVKAETINGTNVMANATMQVSNVGLVENRLDHANVYQVLNRQNGYPIRGAQIRFNFRNSDNSSNTISATTDEYGKFKIDKGVNFYRNAEIEVEHEGLVSFFGNYFLNRLSKDRKTVDFEYRSFLFTDRSIYRPGQIVYFKGILTQTDIQLQKTNVVEEVSVLATLHNSNGEKLSELQLVSNEFGSIKGEFVLPSGGLNGQFFIKTNSKTLGTGFTYFSVEDYKRPKFKAEFKPIVKSFKVNDSIAVKGYALAFAGSSISNAKVMYTVNRKTMLPKWYYWRGPYWNDAPQVIDFGETRTNANGEFEVIFKAIPNQSIPKENLPVFSYEITVDITDLNGETRSAITTVNVGYHSMVLSIDAPERLNKNDKTATIRIDSRNLNGEPISAQGQLKIFKLEPPAEVLRQRPWNAPDFHNLSKEEFKALFPHESYGNEHLLTNWEKGKAVYTTKFNTALNETVLLKRIRKWQAGHYLIELDALDRFGQKVTSKFFTQVYDKDSNHVPDNALFEVELDKETYKPGETAKLRLGSAARDLIITVEIEKDHNIISTYLVNLNNSRQNIDIPVLASDMGGFVVHCSYAAFNSFKSERLRINVPYPSSELQIETKTFRDRLDPNQEETWSFTIKGPQGEKVSAEMLASMYDASLDEFRPHDWTFSPLRDKTYYSQIFKSSNHSFGVGGFRLVNRWTPPQQLVSRRYDRLNWFGFYFGSSNMTFLNKRIRDNAQGIVSIEDVEEEAVMAVAAPEDEIALQGEASGVNPSGEIEGSDHEFNIQIRKNFRETAFFFPQLRTDEEGNISFSFNTPEALTKWKLQLLAHTKTLGSTISQLETVTQKELMVIPNVPRFLREGDQITLSTKIANLSDGTLEGTVQLVLSDATTGNVVTENLIVSQIEQGFSVNAGSNTQVSWQLNISDNLQAIDYKIIAKTESFSDGEQNVLPVLSNRMLVTETLPFWISSKDKKNFRLEKLTTIESSSLKHHKLSLEMTSNPAWYAVQALPYLMEFPYDCNEQIFARYYANAMANHIINSNPKIKAVFDQWKSQDALISNLEKNQELKSLLIEETPWLRDAQSETEQKKRIALLFDLNKVSNELLSAQLKLRNNQEDSGAWSWFKGGPNNRYVTQHIVAGLGHLKHLGINQNTIDQSMVQSAFNFLDKAFVKEYSDLKKYNPEIDLSQNHLSYLQLHYLYARSFYPELKPSKEVKTVIDYYLSQIDTYWLNQSLYAKGLMALTMHRMDKASTASGILKSLEENSITNDELGMYWKANTNSWYWYQAPIETQALLIEAFSEIHKDQKLVDKLKIWLLKNKQTNRWKTTKATTEAVYALLIQGSDWLSIDDSVTVELGGEQIKPASKDDISIEGGSGYFKTSWSGSEIEPKMGNVTVTNSKNSVAWGALYWQYFEDLDKITPSGTPWKLRKKLYLKTNSADGEVITDITSESELQVGDLLKVRIELEVDRPMEFIHLKDMRAAGLEPINVLSQYKWQDGLGYYESTRDAATHFFIDFLPKGIYVFEYELRVNNSGTMSNGISSIQSMYAPEFSSHSEGIKITIH